jgi:hypothetical protein
MSDSLTESCRRLGAQAETMPRRSPTRRAVKWIVIVAVCLVAVFVVLGLVISRPSADQANQAYQGAQQNLSPAAQGGGVTLSEFNAIQSGMTLQQVQQVVRSSGTQISNLDTAGTSNWVYQWQNGDGSNMNVQFQNGVVIGKAQAGLQ